MHDVRRSRYLRMIEGIDKLHDLQHRLRVWQTQRPANPGPERDRWQDEFSAITAELDRLMDEAEQDAAQGSFSAADFAELTRELKEKHGDLPFAELIRKDYNDIMRRHYGEDVSAISTVELARRHLQQIDTRIHQEDNKEDEQQ